jgi:hypothetical protein
MGLYSVWNLGRGRWEANFVGNGVEKFFKNAIKV